MSSSRSRPAVRSGQISADAVTLGADAVRDDADRTFSDAMAQAMRLLAQREHGRAELQAKLTARRVEAEVAAQVLESLRADGLQSEERFAAALVRRRIGRGYGPVYIRGELRKRKVDDEVADAEMNQTDEFWLQLAMQALAQKFASGSKRGNDYNTRARFLARRGFPADIVYRALNGSRQSD